MSEINEQNVYFADAEAEKAAPILSRKAQEWFDTLLTNSYIEKIRSSWLAYHGAYFDEDGHEVYFGGEQGELTQLPVNHYRNIAQHMLVMVTSTRPAFQARSTNTDVKSLVQTTLANSLLDYYMREKRLERYLKRAVEYAIVLGSGYIKMEWNSMTGEIYDHNEELDIPIYEGDVQFSNLSPYDVVFDSTKETSEMDWVICRTFKNKFDLAAKYPEQAEDILEVPTKSDVDKQIMIGKSYDETTDIPVYEFFHKRSEAIPEGRYLLYLDNDIILLDSPMPYRELPIYRISPADILGTPYGYTQMFDLLPLQDALNMLYSAVLTNQNAFAIQNIYVPRGADIVVSQLFGGLNVIEGNQQAGKPEPLQLTATPPEIFNFIQQIEQVMETLSGVNSVARGNPEASLKSGNALALVQSQALQFMSGLQQTYIQTIEDVGTGLVNLLKDFASVPRVAAIVGKNNKTEMKEFVGEDLSGINRVIVDVGNALSQTTAGRLQIADNLLQMGAIQTPEQYFAVMNTGKLETMTEGTNSQIMLIKYENERLTDGSTAVKAVATDNHALHVREHQVVLADPDLRLDDALVARTLAHYQEHITLLQESDPNLLAMLGQQPLGPAAGSPVSAENVPQGEAQGQAGPPGGPLSNPEASSMAPPNQQLPNVAEPVEVMDPRPLK